MGVIFHYRVLRTSACPLMRQRIAASATGESRAGNSENIRLCTRGSRVQWFVQAVRVANPVHQSVQFIDGHVPEALFAQIWQWAEPSWDLHSEDCELAEEEPTAGTPLPRLCAPGNRQGSACLVQSTVSGPVQKFRGSCGLSLSAGPGRRQDGEQDSWQ